MRIAEAAARSGLSIDTIRFYEKSGVLPEIQRGADGQRRFSAENIDWLTLLYWLRETGMPMKTMYRFACLYRAGDHTMPARKEILLSHAEHLKKRRADLDRCKEVLDYKIAIYEERET
jgi:DNA-binding transcriptional MerR regulator